MQFRLRRIGLTVLLLLTGCHPTGPSAKPTDGVVAPGVVFRELTDGTVPAPSPVHLLDIDLNTKGLSIRVAASGARTEKGRVYGDALSVREWCQREGAVAGINGGFFGLTEGSRKEVIGLLATEGEVWSAGRLVQSKEHPDRRFVRSVLGFDANGAPRIGWATGQRGRGALLTDYDTALNPTRQKYWTVTSAVACGPRLAHEGKVLVSDRNEKLVNPPAVARTFVGYSMENGKPRFVALAVGERMTFQGAAEFLQRYFQKYHGVPCAEAMCLDGGSSSQLVYRGKTGWEDTRPTPVTVPTAVLVFAE